MTIKVTLPTGMSTATVSGLHQWDYGQVLEIESPDLPSLVEVHFACAGQSEAIVRSGSTVNGVVSVVIPDTCLEQAANITAWIYEIDGNQGRTTKTITLPIIPRVRPCRSEVVPEDTADVYTELLTKVNELIAALTEGKVTVAHAETASSAEYATSAGSANNAANATNANHATSAGTLSEVLTPEKGGTGCTSLAALGTALGVGGSVNYATNAGHATTADVADRATEALSAENADYATEANKALFANNILNYDGSHYGYSDIEDLIARVDALEKAN